MRVLKFFKNIKYFPSCVRLFPISKAAQSELLSSSLSCFICKLQKQLTFELPYIFYTRIDQGIGTRQVVIDVICTIYLLLFYCICNFFVLYLLHFALYLLHFVLYLLL